MVAALQGCCRDPIFQAAFQSRFSSLLLQLDCDDGVRDSVAPQSWQLLEDAEQAQLVMRMNLRDLATAGQAAPGKLALLVDVRRDQAEALCRQEAKQQLLSFRASVPGTELEGLAWLEEEAYRGLALEPALEVLKTYKTWLAGVLRQLGLVIGRSPAAWREKVRLLRLGVDLGDPLAARVEFAPDTGQLDIVQHMVGCGKPDPTISQRVDQVLDVTMSNLGLEVAGEMRTRSAALGGTKKSSKRRWSWI